MSRVPRYLALAAAVLTLGACSGSITEPNPTAPDCTAASSSKLASPCAASMDLINPSV